MWLRQSPQPHDKIEPGCHRNILWSFVCRIYLWTKTRKILNTCTAISSCINLTQLYVYNNLSVKTSLSECVTLDESSFSLITSPHDFQLHSISFSVIESLYRLLICNYLTNERSCILVTCLVTPEIIVGKELFVTFATPKLPDSRGCLKQ